MTNFKLENVWAIMKNYDFVKENEVDNEMLCSLCNKLMINAHSAPCSCRYCLDCISKYLGEKRKFCPGHTDDCEAELIALTDDVFFDQPMNIKISKIIVKCPEKSCIFKGELRKIEEHLRICNFRSINCPYFNIGCNKSKVFYANMTDHLLLETHSHTKLLMDCIDNLNNEMGSLKTIVDKLRDENRNLKNEKEIKLDGEGKQMKFLELQTKCDEHFREIDLLNQSIVTLRNADKYTKDDVDALKLDGERKQMTIEALERKCEQQNEQIEQLNKKFQQIENKYIDTKQERENNEKDLMRNIDKTMENLQRKLLEIEINPNKQNYGEFVWRIDKFNDKMKDAKIGINKVIYSDPFYSHKHGYKMCLRVDPNGNGDAENTHLSVFFCLMRGEFNDILVWPFKYVITFSLINQQTRLSHVTGTVKYDDYPNDDNWNKPNSERNEGFGFPKFLEFDKLLSNKDLTRNNQIFIKCTANVLS